MPVRTGTIKATLQISFVFTCDECGISEVSDGYAQVEVSVPNPYVLAEYCKPDLALPRHMPVGWSSYPGGLYKTKYLCPRCTRKQ